VARVSAPPAAETTGAPGGDPGRPGGDRPLRHRLDRPLTAARRRATTAWGWLAAIPSRVWLVGTLAVVLIAALLAFELTRATPTPPVTQKDIDTTVQKGIDAQAKAQAAAPPDATVAYQAIQPSLVLITTKRSTAAGAEQATGAGVIVKTDGTILTALHVVSGAESVTVSYTDGTSSPATVVTQTPESDIATLLPSTLPQTLVPAVLGGGVQVGSAVFAVGHPLGLTDSLSAGVVSALDRTVQVGDGKSLQPHPDRRRGQPRQLRRAPAQPGRPGRRHRHRARQPQPAGVLRRDRLRRSHRHCRRRRRQPPSVGAPVDRPSDPSLAPQQPPPSPTRTHPLEQALYEVKRTIVGQDDLLERMIIALLARGHLLVEGVPGLAKTMAIKTLAHAIGGEFQRIQFTPDLVPADLVGTRIYNQRDGEFQVSLGPVFANLVLADEINRAPAKVQSALLEVMQERQVTIGRETFPAPNPFLVMATQNPIESEGTYQLPEAQVDRFMLKVLIGYPSPAEEFVVVERMIGALAATNQVLDADSLRRYQREADQVYVDPGVIQYAVQLATATRNPSIVGRAELARYLTYGASPRASINMVLAARALAYLRGREYALATDVRDLARDVLRHRIVLSYEALAEDMSADDLLTPILDSVRVPQIPLRERPAHAGVPGSPSGSPWTRPPR